MKEIWKKFSTKCKEAWNKTKDSIEAIFHDFVNEAKAIIVQTIDLVMDFVGNTIKSIEVVCMSLVVGVLSALFEAIYDSVIFLFTELKKLFLPKNK
ncbi:MAG: hypothetical protein ACI4V7_05145 [Succinivibrionaceae bacterium]